MHELFVVSKINEYLHSATKELCAWLANKLPRVTDDWWQSCVIDNLSYAQREFAEREQYSKLEDFDLAALLRITDKCWYPMRSFAFLPTKDRECVRAMMKVRNNWAHCAGNLPPKDTVINDLDTILSFFENVIITNVYTNDIVAFKNQIEGTNFAESFAEKEETNPTVAVVANPVVTGGIRERDKVYLISDPDTKGMVFSVDEVGGKKKYEVFVNGDIQVFYEGQIAKVDVAPLMDCMDIESFRTNLTAYEINNPSAGNLYSLNAARIDFVPYQFRPALKMIKSDEQRILIADSVGVGKTIEAGLIIKELEARNELENILIICPKPLVAERKWELEMKRFDEDFVPLSGQELRQVVSDTDRDGEWPSRYSKAIIPYSVLDSKVYFGEDKKKGKTFGLNGLDPAPHFDLVIVDEAHHIRNGSLDKDKAFAYKCVRYFCEHADAVIFLTATPLQTSDDDLFTLLNLLRPDVVLDKESFSMMSKPNEFVYRASHIIRGAADGWQADAIEEMKRITTTQWGESVIAKNPLYASILERLEKPGISREERVKLVSDVEALHSFNTMLNRTRRKDIQDFCIRRSFTVETRFTPQQDNLYNALLKFEFDALSKLYNVRSIPFMMSTIRRQAASCIFGLAPQLRDMIQRRFAQLNDDPYVDGEDYSLDGEATSVLTALAQKVIELAEHLPEDDPKLDSVIKVIDEKQKEDNNKIILFSTFRHTLAYVYKKLTAKGYRVAQIDGSVKDEDRRDLRERFELNKDNPEALDILLFTEVGSEGLDYQFCDMMINYDLPWNPMRIEQRIGRIDRRGQKSPAVNIYNVITAETIDAEIYTRCLKRIGVFERSVGECEEILGTIGAEIEKIAISTSLTAAERCKKLEQMADNEVRHMQELSKLEDEERALFGFDLSNYTAANEIKDAESQWISPLNIQRLVERYLDERLGKGQYIIGAGDLKTIRLNKEARMALLEDFRKLSNVRPALKHKWELYLKGTEYSYKLTFLAETASKERKAFFITPMHPLVKQAAKYFVINKTAYIHLQYRSDELPKGTYPFSVYAWSYMGLHSAFKIVPVCSDDMVAAELTEILQSADSLPTPITSDKSKWKELEEKHIVLWQEEREKYIVEVKNVANFKLESIGNNYRNQKRNLEQKIRDTIEDKMALMYRSQLSNETEKYEAKVAEINARAEKVDIHTTLIANGILEIIGD